MNDKPHLPLSGIYPTNPSTPLPNQADGYELIVLLWVQSCLLHSCVSMITSLSKYSTKNPAASAPQPCTRWSELPDLACTWVGFLLLFFIASVVFASTQKTQFDATRGQQKREHQDSSALKFRGSTMRLSLLITLQLILVGLGFLFPYESNKPPLIFLASGSHVCKS